jgi:diacylglycerol kinase
VTTPSRYEKDVSWRARYRTFFYAARGIGTLLATQWNARIHLACTIVVGGVGFWLGLRAVEWCLLVFAIGLVWVTEALNTSLEFLVDLASPEIHPLAGKAKDVAAGAVLCAAMVAVVIGAIVLGPKFMKLF